MDLFSLEDNDYCNDLFITQSSPKNEGNMPQNGSAITDNPMDFSSPCVSLLPGTGVASTHYSDISEDEFEIPCLQQRSTDTR